MIKILKPASLSLFIAFASLWSNTTDPALQAYQSETREKLSDFGQVINYKSEGELRLNDFGVYAKPENGKSKVVEVEHPRFNQALEVNSLKQGKNLWDVVLHGPAINQEIQKDDVVYYTFYVRCLESENTGIARINAFLERSPEWKSYGGWQGELGNNWKKITIIAPIDDVIQGKSTVKLSIHNADRRQVLQYGGFSAFIVRNDDLDMDAFTRAFSPRLEYAGMEDDAPWRIEAEKRIEKHRKGSLNLQIPKHAQQELKKEKIHYHLENHHFSYGTFLGGVEGENYNSVSLDTIDDYLSYTKNNFNMVTVPFYWASWSTWGWPGKTFEDKYLFSLEYAKLSGHKVRAHVPIWASYKYMPFMKDLEGKPEAIDESIKEHIKFVLGDERINGHIEDWDIINEVYKNNEIIHQFPEKEDKIPDWFEHAHKVDPKANLYINDYGILNQNDLYSDEYYQLIKDLLDAGTPLHGLGLQGHLHGAVPPEQIIDTVERFSEFGIPIQITEFDFTSLFEDDEAKYIEDFIIAIFSQPAVNAMIVWGYWPGTKGTWRPDFTFLDENYEEKALAKMWRSLWNEKWHSEGSAKLTADSELERVYYGDYTVEIGNYLFTLPHRPEQESFTFDPELYIPAEKADKTPWGSKTKDKGLVFDGKSEITFKLDVKETGAYYIGANAHFISEVPEWAKLRFKLSIDDESFSYLHMEGNDRSSAISDRAIELSSGSHEITLLFEENYFDPLYDTEVFLDSLYLIQTLK